MIEKLAAGIILGGLLLIVLFNYLMLGAHSEPPPYAVSKYEGKLLELEREAIDDAFRQKITQLWTVWMSDDRGQPARAIAGATQARKAYIDSMREIERREEENKKR